jgi:hypothetical protein
MRRPLGFHLHLVKPKSWITCNPEVITDTDSLRFPNEW